jgi:hypothetical protein
MTLKAQQNLLVVCIPSPGYVRVLQSCIAVANGNTRAHGDGRPAACLLGAVAGADIAWAHTSP